MSKSISNLDLIKLDLIASRCQVVIFNPEGSVLDSCNTLLEVHSETSVYDQFDFLKSLEEVLPSLPQGEKLEFEMVEWNEQREGLFSISFQKTERDELQWITIDKTRDQEGIAKVQQQRNESAINEEFLEIQRKYLEMEKLLLDYKNEELQRVQKFKEQFFAEVSHEMRTPLNSISGLIQLLKSEMGEPNNDYLTSLKATSLHLNAIINDVLDLSKIEAGKFNLENKAFNLREVVKNILSGFSINASEKGLTLDSEIHSAVPMVVQGDQVRFSQVVYNIFGNALKFTERGSVKVSVDLKKSEKSIHRLRFEISDTGKGMSKSDIEKILEPYAQVEGQDYHRFGGTGLGLGVAHRLIDLMGGQLIIESELEKGTSMSFELTFEEGQLEEKVDEASTQDLSHLKVLFVEDDDIGMVLLRGIAKETGISATFSTTVAAFQNAVGISTFDFIVTDINLPDGDMISAVQSMRTNEGPNQNAKVIFLSGDKSSTYEGLNDLEPFEFLQKPIQTADLVTLLATSTPEVTIDLGNLKASTQGDKGLMKEILDTLLETLPLEVEKLNQAVSNADHEQSRKVLHKINPSISYLGNDGLINKRKSLYAKVTEGQSIKDEMLSFTTLINEALILLGKEKERL